METERERIIKAKKDISEFDYLYSKYFPRINNYIFHRVKDEAVSNEIVSNVFFKAMKKLSYFRFFQSRKSSFSSWLYRIAMNEINQYFRDRKRETVIQKKVNWNYVKGKEIELDYEHLQAQLQKLNSNDQNLITLRFFEKLGYNEIAEVLQEKEGTIKVRMHRLLKKIRSKIEKEIKDERS